jgi:hypothetical protein
MKHIDPEFYLVGGAVRDMAMGIDPKDMDYVIVGANPEWMIENGYDQVGVTFPVYMHPDLNGEYALARREKKTGIGYNGFEVQTEDVTLEQDLQRRDLTINAMALGDDNQIIDPFGGMSDIENGILRHVSDAFKEDPMRVLRIARFAARYDFKIAPETVELCKEIVLSGELDTIDSNRFWKEINRAMKEPYAYRFFEVLLDFDAFLRCDFIGDVFGVLIREWDVVEIKNTLNYIKSIGRDVSVDVIIASVSIDRLGRNFDKCNASSNVKWLGCARKSMERFKFPYTDVIDFCIKYKVFHTKNVEQRKDLLDLIDCNLSDIERRQFHYIFEELAFEPIEIPDGLIGREIAGYKLNFYINKLRAYEESKSKQ